MFRRPTSAGGKIHAIAGTVSKPRPAVAIGPNANAMTVFIFTSSPLKTYFLVLSIRLVTYDLHRNRFELR